MILTKHLDKFPDGANSSAVEQIALGDGLSFIRII